MSPGSDPPRLAAVSQHSAFNRNEQATGKSSFYSSHPAAPHSQLTPLSILANSTSTLFMILHAEPLVQSPANAPSQNRSPRSIDVKSAPMSSFEAFSIEPSSPAIIR